ncbi:Protein SHOOT GRAVITROPISM 5 [Dichanthelium oligosanthes]|uniref:Protein SHOOT GRAVITROPISM 5 n=1 Tax=Dichanthelium oligosanthes TaxID=888268 RepID=A0A1E5UWK3_9POAL|nr:Protein SHOOT GRAVITROPISM 5 [Dichanthelium oligosanthes]
MALLVKSHHQMLASSSTSSSSPSASRQQPVAAAAPPPQAPPPSSSCLTDQQPSPAKRKRRPPGTPDPDAEVVALSPRTLLESDRYVCEICGQGFQREQNLQMHRRRHKVPWRLVKRAPPGGGEDGGGANTAGAGGGTGAASTGGAPRKRVFVCPEPSCLHHDPAHALGDLVGIKKHFRRKHGGRRQWVCARCAKGYAVQSDYKAHLKTCGTRGHSCDCGRVFSRVESFIEHQDACNSGRMRGEVVPAVPSTLPVIRPAVPRHPAAVPTVAPPPPELQLLPASTSAPLTAATAASLSTASQEPQSATTTKLQLSIGPVVVTAASNVADAAAGADGEEDAEELRRAMEEKAAADAARDRAREEAAAAERALEEARRARQRARADLEKAFALRDHAARLLAQVTCHACRQRSLVAMSLAAVGEGHGHGGPAVACDSMRGGGVGAGI